MSGLRLLACFAHPDDEAFPVGGVLAGSASRGVEVRLVTATSGEEGEIRRPNLATPATLGLVRRQELAASVQALGLAGHQVLGYRDSGMAGSAANANPAAFINAPELAVVERLVAEIRRFRPQVVLTFEPGGLYGHPDHIAISRHATVAFRMAADPTAFPAQLGNGVGPHQSQRLFYSARPVGFRMQMALRLRMAGVDFPLPAPERVNDGVPAEQIHLELDVSPHLEAKMACIQCHQSQVALDWPYRRVPRGVAAAILGREHYIRAWPPVGAAEKVPTDFFAGLAQ